MERIEMSGEEIGRLEVERQILDGVLAQHRSSRNPPPAPPFV